MARSDKPMLAFVPRPWAALLHLASLAGAFLLFLGRKQGRFRSETILSVVPDFYLHASNLCLSYLLYAGVGYLWLLMGTPLRCVALAGVALAVVNVVVEAFVPILNTRDMVDAGYGVAGVVAAFAMLWLIHRHGLVRNPAASQPG